MIDRTKTAYKGLWRMSKAHQRNFISRIIYILKIEIGDFRAYMLVKYQMVRRFEDVFLSPATILEHVTMYARDKDEYMEIKSLARQNYGGIYTQDILEKVSVLHKKYGAPLHVSYVLSTIVWSILFTIIFYL